MRTLYIFGNGFDIAHGLNTKYWDFRTFLAENHPEFLLEFEKLYNIWPLDDTEPWYNEKAQQRWETAVGNELWSDFEAYIGNPDITGMLNFSESIIDSLDLETGPIAIRDTMDDYWRQEFGFVCDLQEYVKEWVEQLDISMLYPKKKDLIEANALFLNFNYTQVLEKTYQVDSYDVLHIHGSVGSTAAMDPVMGHCNQEEIINQRNMSKKADEEYDEGVASIHEAIADYLDAIYKDSAYMLRCYNSFFSRLSTIEHVIVLGWSAGEGDLPYLKRVQNSIKEDARWTAYYYDDEAFERLRAAFIKNGITNVQFLKSDNFWDK